MTEAAEAPKVALTRDEIRAALIGKKHPAKSKLVTLFGVEVEFRQPTLATILDAREEEDVLKRTAGVFINYAFVPGTDEKVFEPTDQEQILQWPFTEDLLNVQMTIAELTGIDIGEALEDLKQDPLDE